MVEHVFWTNEFVFLSLSVNAMRLAPIKDQLRYASIAGSHANQVLRLWHYTMGHRCEKMTCDGKLSLELLEKKDSAYHAAVRDGTKWQVISHHVVKEFPNFATLAQAAGNATGQLQRVESELQLLRKLMGAWTSKQGAGAEPVPYAEIAPQILRSKPPNSESLPMLYQFLLRCGGGRTGTLIQATEHFVSAYGFGGRRLGPSIWDHLSLDMKAHAGFPQSQLVHWRHALLKCMYCHFERTISASDVKRSLTSKDMIQKAQCFESLRVELKRIGDRLTDLTPHDRAHWLGVFDVECVLIILGKRPKEKHETFETFKVEQEAAHKCVLEWAKLSKQSVTSPWASYAASTAPQQSASSSQDAASRIHGHVDHGFNSNLQTTQLS